MIAALYVQTGGAYFGLDGVDPWDEPRDARNYDGPHPVVAHPPCSRWCQLAFIVQKRYGHRVGDDGGTFAHALNAVRRFGGVLEHPARSYAWPAFGLPRPSRTGWTRDMHDGAWVCEVSQAAYGHAARKLTWLYYVGDAPPPSLDWRVPAASAGVGGLRRPHGTLPPPAAQVSWCKNHGDSPLPRLSKKAASASPVAFRDVLIEMARGARRAEAA